MIEIKWNDTFEVEIVDNFDEEMDNIGESHNEVLKEGEIVQIDIINEEDGYVDIQFGCGSMILGIQKESFTILEK